MRNVYYGRLHLGKYPYTYARVSVMKRELYKKGDYEKFLKLSFTELVKALGDSQQYREEINELSFNYQGFTLIEHALKLNYARTIAKLKRISQGDLIILIEEYIKRVDIYNLKTVLRGKIAGYNKMDIASLMLPLGTLSEEERKKFIEMRSVEEVLDALSHLKGLEGLTQTYKQAQNLIEIENALDKYYYMVLLSLARKMPVQGHLFKMFLLKEIEILTITAILRMKQEKYPESKIRDSLIGGRYKIPMQDLEDMLNQYEVKNILPIVLRHYPEIQDASKKFEDTGSLIPIEMALKKSLLQGALKMSRHNPLSVSVILGFMFAKEIEIRNLLVISQSKQSELKQEDVEGLLIMR